MQTLDEALNRPENREAKRRIESYQFQISQKMLGLRIRMCLTQPEIANKLGMKLDDYLGFEHAVNLKASRQEYLLVLSKMHDLESKMN